MLALGTPIDRARNVQAGASMGLEGRPDTSRDLSGFSASPYQRSSANSAVIWSGVRPLCLQGRDQYRGVPPRRGLPPSLLSRAMSGEDFVRKSMEPSPVSVPVV